MHIDIGASIHAKTPTARTIDSYDKRSYACAISLLAAFYLTFSLTFHSLSIYRFIHNRFLKQQTISFLVFGGYEDLVW